MYCTERGRTKDNNESGIKEKSNTTKGEGRVTH
jgi:hypothetical protein